MPIISEKGLNANHLKVIAIIAMTIDHLTSVIFPNYPVAPLILLLHIIGRITAPIMWFFVAEGYYYTHDLKKYIQRLFLFSLISHFAYNFAFGIPFIPFQTTIFNQTSVLWSLAWGLVALAISQSTDPRLKQWVKSTLIISICVIAFCADWSSIGTMAIMYIGIYRGNFKKQMSRMVLLVAMYATVYFLFINKVYGILQLFVVLSIPLLRQYNGSRGNWKGMKWFFYAYYPLHLFVCGFIRILLYGNIGVMIGG